MGVVPVDGMAAARTLLTFSGITPGYCLHYVWTAYQRNGAVSDGKYYPTALSAWNQASGRHEGDRNPPPGVPVYLGARSGSNAGDVVISMGGGIVAATDWPYNGATGQCTITQRMSQTGRPYLGWVDNILGFPVLLGQGGGGDNETEEEMPIGFVRIQGKTGVRRGGMYAVVSRPGAKPAAVFMPQGGPTDLGALNDDSAIAQLQGLIDGLQ